MQSDEIVEIRNSFLNEFLLNTRFGLAVNIVSCATLAIVAVAAPSTFHSAYETIFKPSIILPLIAVILFMHLIVVLVVYLPSRLSSATSFSWLIGTYGSLLVTAIALIDLKIIYFNGVCRLLLGEEFTRLTMKIVAFLYECNKSDQVFRESTVESFVYFLFVPTLRYRVEYPKVTQNIRWHLVTINVMWLFLVPIFYLHLFDEFIYPLCMMDLATVNSNQFLLKTGYTVSFSAFTYLIMVTFYFFSVWNEIFAELLHFADRRLFGDPWDVLKGTKLVRSINIVVSDFLYHYVYKPFHAKADSRFFALFMVYFISILFHELVESYTLIQLVLPNFLAAILIPLVLVKRYTSLIVRMLQTVAVVVGLSFYLYIHLLEFMAWRSSHPHLEKETKWRVWPLCFKLLPRIFSPS